MPQKREAYFLIKWQYFFYYAAELLWSPNCISFLASPTSLCISQFCHFQFLQFPVDELIPFPAVFHLWLDFTWNVKTKYVEWKRNILSLKSEREAKIRLFEMRLLWCLIYLHLFGNYIDFLIHILFSHTSPCKSLANDTWAKTVIIII